MSDAINPDHYKRLPAEAIEIIESAIDNAPSNQDGYLHGQVLKYILRCWNKNGIEDLRKAKWYLDRLIESFNEIDLLNPAERPKPTVEVTVEVTGEVKNPIGCPDGWRFLEVGEVIRNGDIPFENGQMYTLGLLMIGQTYQTHWMPIIRRNRFEVGEKVVHVNGINVCEVVECDHEKNRYAITYNGSEYAYESKWLAPYIEDAT